MDRFDALDAVNPGDDVLDPSAQREIANLPHEDTRAVNLEADIEQTVCLERIDHAITQPDRA